MDSKALILVFSLLSAAWLLSGTEALYGQNTDFNGRRSVTMVCLTFLYSLSSLKFALITICQSIVWKKERLMSTTFWTEECSKPECFGHRVHELIDQFYCNCNQNHSWTGSLKERKTFILEDNKTFFHPEISQEVKKREETNIWRSGEEANVKMFVITLWPVIGLVTLQTRVKKSRRNGFKTGQL